MNAEQILLGLLERGIVVRLEEGELALDLPDEGIDEASLDLVRANKAALIEVLARIQGNGQRFVIDAWGDSYDCPLSNAQKRMLFLEELAEGTSYYNIPVAYRLKGAIDHAALEHALNTLCARHDVLRTIYPRIHGERVQHVCAPTHLPLKVTSVDKDDRVSHRISALLQADSAHVFNLEKEWPIRAHLIEVGPDEAYLSLNIHHIAADGWSARVIVDEISKAYDDVHALRVDRRNAQYADYVQWESAWHGNDEWRKMRDAWKSVLAGMPELHSLPTDHVRPAVQMVAGACVEHEIPTSLIESVDDFARQQGVTRFVVLQAAFAAWLARISDQTDIVFGTAAANRERHECQAMVGLFVNTLVLRHQFAEDATFSDMVRLARDVSRDAFERQRFPFDDLVDELAPKRSLGFNPLVQLMLVMQEDAAAGLRLKNIEIEPIRNRQSVSKFDLALHLVAQASGMRCEWEFSTALFSTETIVRWAHSFEAALRQLLHRPNIAVGMLELVDPSLAVARAAMELPEPRCVHRLFEQQVSIHGDMPAVSDGTESLSYAALDHRANALAMRLLDRKLDGQRVAVCMDKSIDLVVSMLAIYKAGATYVPIDPSYPVERIEFMLEDSGVNVMLVAGGQFLMDGICTEIERLNIHDKCSAGYHDLHGYGNQVGFPAYIIYTSGSTGKPKGVLVSHRNLYHSLWANGNLMDFSEVDSMPTIGSQAFGVSLLEILLPLTRGGCVSIIRKSDSLDMHRLIELTGHVSVLHAVPSLMRQWLDALLTSPEADHYPHLRLLLVGGESVPEGLLQRIRTWRPELRLIELYGMTESTIVCSSFEAATDAPAHYCIGRPHATANFIVLNRHGRCQPVGIPGELHIGGPSIALGYLNQAALTEERFVANPYRANERIYRTGDRVRELSDGNYEFLGRVDHQVSLRGARIEMGEIETLAATVPGVRQAVAHVVELAQDEQILVLYCTCEEGGDQVIPALRACFSRHLPDYMRPSVIQTVEAFPLNPNGKVDRKRLPSILAHEKSDATQPSTDVERKLLVLWEDVLQRTGFGVDTNFFDAGGHSLMATRIATRVRTEFGIDFALAQMFAAPTVRQCAQQIESALLARQQSLLAGIPSNIEPIEQVERSGKLPLSHGQQVLWLVDQIEGGSAQFNVPGRVTLHGNFDAEAFDWAMSRILERHESLRTCFRVDEHDEPVQIIQTATPFRSVRIDLSEQAPSEQLELIERIAHEDAWRPFDLTKDLMVRAHIVKLGEREHVVMLNVHHIAGDGWSLAVLLREASAYYNASITGLRLELPPLPVQYADYAAWQRIQLQGPRHQKQVAYWTEKLLGIPTVHNLPLDRPRPPVQTFKGRFLHSRVSSPVVSALNRICRDHGATLFMGLHAAFSVLLARYSNEDDIVVGTPIANREHKDIAGLIGFFVNTLVLRTDISDNPDFHVLLERSKQTLLGAYANQQVPIDHIAEHLNIERSPSHSRLFQIMLILQNNDQGIVQFDGLTAGELNLTSPLSKFDLSLYMSERDGELHLDWEYNTDLFDASTIIRLGVHLENLIGALAKHPDVPVKRIDFLDAAERQIILENCYGPASNAHVGICMHELFDEQVRNCPQSFALEFEHLSYTYGELDQLTNRVAHYLRENGAAAPDRLIGICMDRSADAIIAMIAIHKAGAAYLPLDPNYPEERIRYMLEDGQLTTVLTHTGTAKTLGLSDDICVCMDDMAIQQAIARHSNAPLPPASTGVCPNHLAYVIYTSGSTGRPKGVMITHANLVNLVLDLRQRHGLQPSDSVLQFASICFDMSVEEIFATLGTGARLVVRSDEWIDTPSGFWRRCAERSISVLNLPTAYWHELAAEPSIDVPPVVRHIAIGGEAVNMQMLALWRRHMSTANVSLLNCYGPTEATVNAAYASMAGADQGIGRASRNAGLMVLSAAGALCPIGVPGELHLQGTGLARGYFRRPDLTADRFIPNPLPVGENSAQTSRMYRTGDLVRLRADGNIEFLGRIDHQVKIRGFRVELGEIEAHLSQCDNVRDVLVMAQRRVTGDNVLIAWVLLDAGDPALDESSRERSVYEKSLRSTLSAQLPDYMIPAAFVMLDAWPKMPNGKINRHALPQPSLSHLTHEYEAPRSETEHMLASIWQEVLGGIVCGRRDNFFERGGHSLSATRVIARVNQELGVSIPLKTLFLNPTLEAFASIVETQGQAKPGRAFDKKGCNGKTETSYSQTRLWVLDQLEGGSSHYNLIGLARLTGPLDVDLVSRVFERIIDRHESLRTRFVADANGQPFQCIDEVGTFKVELHDLENFDSAQQTVMIEQGVQAERQHCFDLTNGKLVRVHLFRLHGSEHVLLMNMHHIVSDGWSGVILVREFCALYAAAQSGLPEPLAALQYQYADYARWQRSELTGAAFENELQYWTEQLRALPIVHQLPLDHVRPPVQTFSGATLYRRISLQTREAFSALCQSRDATLFMGLHTIFAALLARYSGEHDIVIGTPIANRERIETADLIGFFVNTLVLRTDLSDEPSFSQSLMRNRAMLLDAYAHQQVPFEKIVERLQPERDLSINPLFQVMLVLTDQADGGFELGDFSLQPMRVPSGIAKFDLLLNVNIDADGLELEWEFNTDLFERDSIKRMATHFERLLDQCIATPDFAMQQMPILSSIERTQLLQPMPAIYANQMSNGCVHDWFLARAVEHPQRPAVEHLGQVMSYGELNTRADELAARIMGCLSTHHLNSSSTDSERQATPLVGVCIDRSVDLIIGILATLKAGAAFVPLDPAYPLERLQYMIDDAGLGVILTRREIATAAGVDVGRCLFVDEPDLLNEAVATGASEISGATTEQGRLAYVIYTSGSTGQPKGVMVEHASLSNLIADVMARYGTTAQDRVLQFASINFDMSLEDVFGALCAGACLVLRDESWLNSPREFWRLCQEHGITMLDLPTAYWHELAADAGAQPAPSIRHISIGGEGVSPTLVQRWLQSPASSAIRLLNVYGPTECTVDASFADFSKGERGIGRPMSNTLMLVLDRHGHLCPIGVQGELYIGGAGVARGYLNRAALTLERFIENPLYSQGDTAVKAGLRLYRTGDLVRRCVDGCFEFLGRADDQVKLRGYRIELGEIESTIRSIDGVRDVIVLLKDGHGGGSMLVAYLLTSDTVDDGGSGLEQNDEWFLPMQTALARTLPSYMIPGAWVKLQQWPTTPNGKIDRKALPAPVVRSGARTVRAPADAIEAAMLAIWREVLGVDTIGTDDNFFEFGGHSLLATRLIARINQEFSCVVALKSVFVTPTVIGLANEIRQLSRSTGSQRLEPVPRSASMPTSFAQRRLWLLDQIEGGSAHYNMPGALRISGNLDLGAVRAAVDQIVARHEVLRTSFAPDVDGIPVQRIHREVSVPFSIVDLTAVTPLMREQQLRNTLKLESQRLFELGNAPLIRVCVIRLSDVESVLFFNMHHIISDGWSTGVLVNEFCAIYEALTHDSVPALTSLSIQYADYAVWQNNWLQGDELERQLQYWVAQLESLPVVHNLPLDYPRPATQSFSGARYRTRISSARMVALEKLCRTRGATLFMGLHAVFTTLLSRYSQQEDIVIGSPIANREQVKIENLIGLFVNTLVLRTDLSGMPSFLELLERVRVMLLNAYAHQQAPFEQIVERIRPERSFSHSPLFQIMLVLQNNADAELKLGDLIVTPIPVGDDLAKFDLMLNATPDSDGMLLEWEFNTDIFDATTIQRMAAHFDRLWDAVLEQPNMPLQSIQLLDQRELKQLLVDWNSNFVLQPSLQGLHQLFENQVEKTPQAIALRCDGDQISYLELERRANQFARYLKAERKIQREQLIGVCLDRNIDMVITLLGILKLGAAYVPLDPDYPEARLNFIANDASLNTIVTLDRVWQRIGVEVERCVCIDRADVREALAQHTTDAIGGDEHVVQGSHLAYVIYTSGSTGQPKGVMIEHRNAVNFINWALSVFDANSLDTTLFATSLNFDLSIYECFVPLACGRTVVIVRNALSLLEQSVDVTLINTVPSAIDALCQVGAIPTSVKTINLAGEPLKRTLVESLFTRTSVEAINNLYGPTETTTYSTWTRMTRETGFVSHIGRPIGNTNLYVLDSLRQPVPIGVAGELYIGGAGVARAYLNRPELTAERFLPDPFVSDACARMYKTGDLVRYRPDGSVEYLGRNDFQVKIRGFRVELGEIENTLQSARGVSDAMVQLQSHESGDQELIAYLIVEQDSAALSGIVAEREAWLHALNAELATKLPPYMLPSAWVALTSWPLTPNGKIDRSALPAPSRSVRQVSGIGPRNDVESTLLAIFEDVLGVSNVGVTDNFFAIGGHSLSATRVMARANEAFSTSITLKQFFLAPSVEGLSRIVGASDRNAQAIIVAREGDRPSLLSYSQQRLWLLDRIEGGSAHYNMAGALTLRGAVDIDAANRAFARIIERHEVLRTGFTTDDDGQPLLQIQDVSTFSIEVIDLTAAPAHARDQLIEAEMTRLATHVFDLTTAPLLLVRIVTLGSDDHVLLTNMHHIVSDGWSVSILIREFCVLYEAFSDGRDDPMPSLGLQYADYAHWQRTWLQGDELERQMLYWQTQLTGMPSVHNLPLDHPRPRLQTYSGAVVHSHIAAEVHRELESLCQAHGATLFMGLHTVFAALLSRYSNERDIVIGSPIANREQAGIAELIGFFVNTLVLRTDLSGEPGFIESLQRNRAMLLDAYAHQQVPFEQIVERIQPERSLSHSPMFQVMLVLQNNVEADIRVRDLAIAELDSPHRVSKFDLLLDISARADGLTLEWEYNPDLFEASTIERMATHFGALLRNVLRSPTEPLLRIDMLEPRERSLILREWNKHCALRAPEHHAHRIFEHKADAQPEAVAIELEGNSLTYRELDERANRLANLIIARHGVSTNRLIGVCLERSFDLVAAILAVLKSGAAYVPLDPKLPDARLSFIASDAALEMVLTSETLADIPLLGSGQVKDVVVIGHLQMQDLPASRPEVNGAENDLAYVLYTSGSTGQPKGVMQTHRTLVNLVHAQALNDKIMAPARTLQFAPIGFDVSIQELVTAWHTGSTLVMMTEDIKQDLPGLPQRLMQWSIERLFVPPAVLHWIADASVDMGLRLPALREIVVAGEALIQDSALLAFRRDHPECRVINHYGPTETHVATTAIVSSDVAAVEIGRAIPGMCAYVLDALQQLVPIGVVGELYLSGAGLAHGYLGRPDLDEQKFVENPFIASGESAMTDELHNRMYRTGDLVRWRHDGVLEFIGRTDDQIKLRGFRIELGEIEARLSTHAVIREAFAMIREVGGDKRLAAYVTLIEGARDTAVGNVSEESELALLQELYEYLHASLPEYMIPTEFAVLERLPLTANGKVDRRLLPEPRSMGAGAYRAPTTETEIALSEIWRELLQVEQVGANDNFFLLGGHSLLATRAITRTNQHFSIGLPLQSLFGAQSLESFARVVDTQVALRDMRIDSNTSLRDNEEELTL